MTKVSDRNAGNIKLRINPPENQNGQNIKIDFRLTKHGEPQAHSTERVKVNLFFQSFFSHFEFPED